ncbi:MFS transporter [Dictyobacter aurantiacus]|uniref:MFS transporter n=1 Tax=Dictyobacter aurantiacus TaxID=1936993 RepID=A0A401ZMC3_9CHLR|nr:MFS transporter [Dictyobacter aurantiacus]GCE07988.1 MFS transporter [Dictyobacter aurantiacus]
MADEDVSEPIDPASSQVAVPEEALEAEVLTSVISKRPKKSLLSAFTSLRHRNFRLYWSGQVISQLGSYMQGIGQSWLVWQLTHSAWQLGLVGALQAVPVLFFALFGGVLADRWPKRHVLLCTQTAAMIQALLLWGLIATGVVQLWHLYILALMLGLTNCLGRPTGQAFVVEMVGREDLPNAVGLNSMLSQMTRIVGPGLGGIVIALSGVPILFLYNGLSYLAAIAALVLIKNHELYAQAVPMKGEERRKNTWQSLREGVEYVWRTPTILRLILVVGLVLLFGSNFGVLLPSFATDVLHGGPESFGFLSAAMGTGALLASLWLAWNNEQPTFRRVLISMLIFAVLEILFALSGWYVLSLILIAGVGGLEIDFAAQAMTALQTAAPDHLRGRVMSVQILFFDGSLPLGYLLIGWLSGLFGPQPAMFTGAILCLLVTAVGWIWHKAGTR